MKLPIALTLLAASAAVAQTAQPGFEAPRAAAPQRPCLTPDEARGLAYAAANGVVTLALAPPEDACCSSPGS